MSYIDSRFRKKEPKFKRNYEIEDTLYYELEKLTHIYDASVSDLVNACIEYLIETEKVILYSKKITETSISHSMLIRESNIQGLNKLKEQYGISIYKLVNIAVRNALEETQN